MKTLAQAYKDCRGQVPHRHSDVIYPCGPYLESNIICYITPYIKDSFCLTFPKDQVMPDGYEYLCTVQEFIDFVPTVELIDGKAYQFDYNGRTD